VAGLTGLSGKKVCCIVSGGNIDVNVLSLIIERGLIEQGRLVRIKIRLHDRPGALAELSEVVAGTRANVLDIKHDRTSADVRLGDAQVEIALETRGSDHANEVLQTLNEAGFPPTEA
jgi:threonine dehydratase